MDMYLGAIIALFLMAVLLLVNVSILDYTLLKVRHIPGTEIDGNHSDFSFRANRALANLNESFSGFIVLVIVAFLIKASPDWVNITSLFYALSRITYTMAYYLNKQKVRSIAFGCSLAALIILVIIDGKVLLELY